MYHEIYWTNEWPDHVRFQEHFRYYKYANNKSKFSQHLLDNRHSTGPMESIMDVIYTANKGRLLDTMGTFYIHKETHTNNQIYGKNTAKPNIMFEIITQEDTGTQHTAS